MGTESAHPDWFCPIKPLVRLRQRKAQLVDDVIQQPAISVSDENELVGFFDRDEGWVEVDGGDDSTVWQGQDRLDGEDERGFVVRIGDDRCTEGGQEGWAEKTLEIGVAEIGVSAGGVVAVEAEHDPRHDRADRVGGFGVDWFDSLIGPW